MTIRFFHSVLLLCSALLVVPELLAQHETGSDLLNGERAFRDYCANCHGPDGDLIKEVDLGHNNFRQPYSDQEIVAIIMNGIPNTPMPATPRVSEEQAAMLVAYLRSLGESDDTSVSGNVARGKTLYEGRGECMDCHMINGKGSVLGPDLSSIALVRSAAELEKSLLEPNSEVQPGNRFYSVQTLSGEKVSGRLLNHDAFTIQMLASNEKLRAFEKSQLLSFGFSNPDMPSLSTDYTSQEIADLVAYLTTLRRGAAQ
jgi:putative heme-binding domain-containing protein